MDGLSDQSASGAANSSADDELARIIYALEATYNPRSTNSARQSALEYLEATKKRQDAPENGLALARDRSQQAAVRHFGLSLLEYAIRYRWEDYSEEQASFLRQWVISLARDIQQEDALYLRNKVGHLWVEVAKRCWAGEWMDMDELLVVMWDTADSSKQVPYRILVLYILECLSDDICNKEDPIAGLRQETLGQSLNEIIIPVGLYAKHLDARGHAQDVRYHQDGWLVRTSHFLSACMSAQSNNAILECSMKTLNALKPTVVWVSFEALIEAGVMECLFQALASPNLAVQTAAIEVLFAIVSRPYNPHFQGTWSQIMRFPLRPDRISLMSNAFSSWQTNAEDIDEPKYTARKKLAEILSVLGDAAAQNPELLEAQAEKFAFLDLLLSVFQSQSLLVSIPILHSFTRLLQTQDSPLAELIHERAGMFVQICTARLMKYESLPSDLDDPTVLYLNDDFENLPELHAFLGNYRRYCVEVIEIIGRTVPRESLEYILNETASMLPKVSDTLSNASAFSKNALPVLQFDAQLTSVRSALTGFMQWLGINYQEDTKGTIASPVQETREAVFTKLRAWCGAIIASPCQDPEVARICVQAIVHIVTRILPAQSDIALATLDYLFNANVADDPSRPEYSESVKLFQSCRMQELQRVAITFPDYLTEVYAELEARINSMPDSEVSDNRVRWGFRAFLFIIVHRSSVLDQQVRVARLQDMLRPIISAWQEPKLTAALAEFPKFCGLVGLNAVPDYISTSRFGEATSWDQAPLSQQGRELQAGINAKTAQLPLRMTNSMLGASTEKLKEGSQQYDVGAAVWAPAIQAILPNLLAMLKHATAFSDPAKWTHLPPELQLVMQRMLVDRFWQSGISNESRDDFYARINSSAFTYEGFASTVRGTPRQIRDASYHVIHGMTRFEEQFYGLRELPQPLADALFTDCQALSTHHLTRLLSLVEKLVDRCPPIHRRYFLPPLLIPFFLQMDAKISAEWDAIEKVKQQSTEDDQLGDEMKNESILRALTYSMVTFVSALLDHRRADAAYEGQSKASLRNLVLSDAAILEPLILFCTHALRMRDSRCCTMICRVMRQMVPTFLNDDAGSSSVREFICTEVLQASILSLNEPYFTDVQRDLANLVANIIFNYCPRTSTPRAVLLSLPDMQAEKVDRSLDRICKAGSERQQRALVLDLLEGVRGVSIHEAGKIDRRDAKQKRSAMQQQFMEVEQQQPAIKRGGSPGLEGMADLFGDA